jgi:hypothetical protein
VLNIAIMTSYLAWSSKRVSHLTSTVIPRSEKTEPKPLYMCPGCSNHMYNYNMIRQMQYLDKLQAKLLQNDPWVRKKITIMKQPNLSVGAASIGTAGGEAGLASFFFILLVPLI